MSSMGECIIHFGMHKTGSSSIQESLFRRLDDPRFLYVGLGQPNPSGKIATAFLEDASKYHGNKKLGLSAHELTRLRRQAIETLKAEVAEGAGRKRIISAEGISQLDQREFADFVRTIGEAGCRRVTAVGYVRSPMRFMESVFQQRVKGGLKRFNIGRMYPNYRARFEKLEQVLGAENVQYWRFEPGTFPGGCVVQDFCRRFDIQLAPEAVVRTNEALSRQAVSLLYAYYKLGPGYGRGRTVVAENDLLVSTVANLAGAKLRFHSSLAMPVIEENRDDLEWMAARLGGPLLEEPDSDERLAVRSEEELLAFEPDTLQWLADQLGPDYQAKWHPGMGAGQVAEWMHALRSKLAREDPQLPWRIAAAERRQARIEEERILDVVQRAKKAVPELSVLPDHRAVRLLKEVFAQITRELGAVEQGALEVAVLGHFRVIQLNQDGVSLRREVFRPGGRRQVEAEHGSEPSTESCL